MKEFTEPNRNKKNQSPLRQQKKCLKQ